MGKSRCQKDRQEKGSGGDLVMWLSAVFWQTEANLGFFLGAGKISILRGFPDEGKGNGAQFGVIFL
jgi:hypothetical protein